MKANFKVQEMTDAHLNEVLQIQAACNLSEWTANDYQKELNNSFSVMLIANEENHMLGFVLSRLIMQSLEILNLGVLPEKRREGIGDALLKTVLEKAKKKGAIESWLELRESNFTAFKFYLSHDYKIVGRRKRYYSNPVEDAILMTLDFLDNNPKK